MNGGLRYYAIGLFLLMLVVPAFSSAQEELEQSGFCTVMGWLVRPVGFCEKKETPVVVVTHDKEVDLPPTVPVAPTVSTPSVQPPTIIEYSTTTTPIYNEITNEYVTIEQQGVSEGLLDQRIAEVLMYINSLPHSIERGLPEEVILSSGSAEGEYVTKEYVLKSLDKVYDRIADINTSGGGGGGSSFDEGDISNLTNITFDGINNVIGSLGIGTSSPSDMLAVAGAIYLAETIPGQTANRLYNQGGDLYWNGVLVNASTTSNWSAASGNVFRLAGGVGIGTSTLTETLTVDGTALFTGTTTAPIVDAGGQVCNVVAYGAVGDNSTLNDAAIARAIADCPLGGTVYFPMGQFRIASPIVLDKPVTLRGAYSPRWSYSSTPRSSIRADFGSFSGNAMIHVRDRSISGEAADNNGGRIEHLSLDGGSASVGVEGIYFEGLVRDWKLTDMDIAQTTGNGFEAAVGTGSGNPRGFTIRGLAIYSADGHGFRATALNDTYIDDLLSVGNALRGIYLSSMGETKIANSRAVFNGLTGLYIDGSSNNGGITFTDFSTDRNDRHGVRISATGTSTIIFNGLLTRRDGPNTSGGTETPYAGVAIIGSSTDKVAPVFISGLGQTVGVDDVGAPPLSPSVGVRVTNAEYVKIDGQLWGVDDAWQDDGGNDFFIIEDDAILKTGTAGAQELFTNERKWVSTSTNELFFGNRVSIGSSTDSRLLNIVAPSQAGARFRDTTNNVTFDMRAEDFQAFFGTFSNHQLRFQTNNLSRLTIDNDGDIGIGTTSPVAMLEIRASNTDDLLNLFNNAGQAIFVVEEGGNVGIGTTSPQDALQIAGGGIILDNNQTLRWYDSASNLDTILRYDASNDLEIGFGVGNVTQIFGQNGVQFSAGGGEVARFNSAGDFGIGDTSPDFALEVSASTSNGYFGLTGVANGDILTVDGAGDVGIGTNNPGERLHVSGGNLLLENTRAIRWQNNSATANTIMAYNSSNDLEVGSGIGGALELYGNSRLMFHVSGNEVGRFDAEGNLGLFDQTPDFMFEVASTTPSGYLGITSVIDGDILTVNSLGNVGIGTSSPTTKLQVDGVIAPNLDNTYSLGNTSYRFSEIFSANGVINTSDRRLKDDIDGLEYGLDTLLQLEPVSFTWKDNPEQGTKFGLIAQDVQALMPEVVHVGDDERQTLGVRYTELIAVVIHSIQELWEMVTGNTERISELELRIQQLEHAQGVDSAEPEPKPAQDPVSEEVFDDVSIEEVTVEDIGMLEEVTQEALDEEVILENNNEPETADTPQEGIEEVELPAETPVAEPIPDTE